MCRKPLVKGMKWVAMADEKRHICIDCVKVCKEIVKDPTTGPFVYLNEYKDMKERERG